MGPGKGNRVGRNGGGRVWRLCPSHPEPALFFGMGPGIGRESGGNWGVRRVGGVGGGGCGDCVFKYPEAALFFGMGSGIGNRARGNRKGL